MNAIELDSLGKTFRVPVRRGNAVQRLLRPAYRDGHALRDLSLTVPLGERVALVGPNGAGKSTTIKLLSGILRPSSGSVRVLGHVPWRERRELGFRISTVFGQRSRLWLHLPVEDTFALLARVYDLPAAVYRERRRELVGAFDIGGLMERPVRQLSLGERMRCELAASLLHHPQVLFLDEPTIGLDVVAKSTLREMVRERSERDGCTVLLTSHDTGDMERVCDRVVVLHRGELLLDTPLAALRKDFIRRKLVTVVTEEERVEVRLPGVALASARPHRSVFSVDTAATPVERVVQEALQASRLLDLTVEDPPMEEVIGEIYAEAERKRAAAEVGHAVA